MMEYYALNMDFKITQGSGEPLIPVRYNAFMICSRIPYIP